MSPLLGRFNFMPSLAKRRKGVQRAKPFGREERKRFMKLVYAILFSLVVFVVFGPFMSSIVFSVLGIVLLVAVIRKLTK